MFTGSFLPGAPRAGSATGMRMEPPPSDDAQPIDSGTPTILIAVASIFELLSAILICNQGECRGLEWYAVVVGVVSISLIMPVAIATFAPSMLPITPKLLQEGVEGLSLLLLAWWMPAAFLLTFVLPFQHLCNGYFASLIGFIGALQLCRAHVPAVVRAFDDVRVALRSLPQGHLLLCVLALTSTAVWIEAAVSLGLYTGEHSAVKSWAVAVGLVSFAVCTAYLFVGEATSHRYNFAVLLAIWWVQGCLLLVRAINLYGHGQWFLCNVRRTFPHSAPHIWRCSHSLALCQVGIRVLGLLLCVHQSHHAA